MTIQSCSKLANKVSVSVFWSKVLQNRFLKLLRVSILVRDLIMFSCCHTEWERCRVKQCACVSSR